MGRTRWTQTHGDDRAPYLSCTYGRERTRWTEGMRLIRALTAAGCQPQAALRYARATLAHVDAFGISGDSVR
jgi:hypothetical protein